MLSENLFSGWFRLLSDNSGQFMMATTSWFLVANGWFSWLWWLIVFLVGDGRVWFMMVHGGRFLFSWWWMITGRCSSMLAAGSCMYHLGKLLGNPYRWLLHPSLLQRSTIAIGIVQPTKGIMLIMIPMNVDHMYIDHYSFYGSPLINHYLKTQWT